jgi:copper transport protein
MRTAPVASGAGALEVGATSDAVVAATSTAGPTSAGAGPGGTARAQSVASAGGGTALLERDGDDAAGDDDSGDDGVGDGNAGGGSGLDGTLAVVGRFSTAAAVSVVLLAIAGLVLGVVQVGSIRGLFTTSYGQLLLVKLAIVVVILAMAGFNRYRLLPALGVPANSKDVAPPAAAAPAAVVGPDGQRWRSLRRAVTFEALGIVAVLGVTAALANTPTSASLPPPPVAFSARQPWEAGSVQLDVTPNAAGANGFSVQFLDAAGTPVDPVQGVSVYLKLPSQGVGPLNKNLNKVGPGHFTLDKASDLSIPGQWTITLQVRIKDFDQRDVDFTDTVT